LQAGLGREQGGSSGTAATGVTAPG
jgi:hypothetical protein